MKLKIINLLSILLEAKNSSFLICDLVITYFFSCFYVFIDDFTTNFVFFCQLKSNLHTTMQILKIKIIEMLFETKPCFQSKKKQSQNIIRGISAFVWLKVERKEESFFYLY